MVLACAIPEQVEAGKNANGAMIVHTTDSVVYTVTGDYCETHFNDPGTCEQAGTRTDKDVATPAVIWLLAAFDETAQPGVSVVYFGIEHNLPPGLGYFADWSLCGPPNSIEVTDTGWPETGYGNSIAFSSPILNDRLFPFYWFSAYGFDGAFLGTATNPTGGYAGFIDDGSPGEPDECFNFGRVQWYADGFNTCPVPSDCQVTLVQPDGGENWGQGTLQTISWTSTECGDNVRIDLLRSGIRCQTISQETPNDGDYSWVAQQCNSNPSGYEILISDLVSGVEDRSDGTFSIPAGSCQLDVTAPTEGVVWNAGQPYEILWGFGGTCGSDVRIELVHQGEVCLVLDESTPNDGSYSWAPEQCTAESCGYKIRVTDLLTNLADESDGSFCIRACDLAMVSPNGGEHWDTGAEYEILWDEQDCGSLVRIDLLHDGTQCDVISTSTENDGQYSWTAEQCDEMPDAYQVRITDLATGQADSSDGTFTIGGCQVSVLLPNGGESWPEGTQQTLQWISSLCGSEVRIELLQNGDLCLLLAESAPNTGLWNWTVESCGSDPSGYAVRIIDIASGFSDESDQSFVIPLCDVVVNQPNGGEVWIQGSEQTILWDRSDCGDSVRLELLRDEEICALIAESTPNDGLFPWTVAGCDDDATGYRVRVTDLRTGRTDESDAAFSIPVCAVTVINPAGGEMWVPGDTETITWDSADCGDAVRVDLLQEGEVCLTITDETPNDGTYPWTVEACGGDPSAYRIRVTDLLSDNHGESPEDFCIGCGTGRYYFDEGIELAQGHSGIELNVSGSNTDPIRGYSIHFCFDPLVFECVSMGLDGTRGDGALQFTEQCEVDCAGATVLYSTSCPPNIEGGDGVLLKVVLNVKEDAPLGTTSLEFSVEDPSVNTMTLCTGPVISPILADGTVEIVREEFQRGDDDASGRTDILDPIYCLAHQYADGPAPPCLDAGDFDDSGRYDIADCIANLCYQFGECAEPPPPFSGCGPDPTTDDTLRCASFAPCGTGSGNPSLPLEDRRLTDSSIRLGPVVTAASDTLLIPLTLRTSRPLAAIQFLLGYDTRVLDFVDLVDSADGLGFFSGKDNRATGEVHVGIVPDLTLSEPIPAGTTPLGIARFAWRLDSSRTKCSLDLSSVLAGGADLTRLELAGDRIDIGAEAGTPQDAPRLYLPNPFRPGSVLRLTLPVHSRVLVSLYNVQGQRIRTFWSGDVDRGRHESVWDGRSDKGAPVGSGIYYLGGTINGIQVERKLTLVR